MSASLLFGLCIAVWIYLVFAVEVNQLIWLLLNIIDSFSALSTYQSAGSRDHAALRDPIKVWIVWLAVTTLDNYVSPVLGWIPFYNLHRSIFSGFMLFSRCTASGFIYETLIHPRLLPWQHHIDLLLSFSTTTFELIAHFLVVRPGQWVLPNVFTSDMKTVIHQIRDKGFAPRRLLFHHSAMSPRAQHRHTRRPARSSVGYCHERPVLDPCNPFYVATQTLEEVSRLHHPVVAPSKRHKRLQEPEEQISEQSEIVCTSWEGVSHSIDRGPNVTPYRIRDRSITSYHQNILWAPRKPRLHCEFWENELSASESQWII